MQIDYFLEHLSRLDNVHQWEERDSIIKESVSQHSFKVSAIAHFILTVLEKEMKGVNPEFIQFKADCLSYAILHDFDEAIIGRDISHVVKYNPYNGEKIREAINDFVNHQETLDFQGLLPKPTDEVKKFVKICDWIALSTFCKRNSELGCRAFEKETRYCEISIIRAVEAFAPFCAKKFDIILSKLFNEKVVYGYTEKKAFQ